MKATGTVVRNVSAQQGTLQGGKVTRWRGREDTAGTRDGFRK
ncbi:MAG TPA: hypothetical protein VHE35_34430 [Kofleriaceae bacterium]|nr:hypothetical protein [Kofleriaceae bacterium]